MKVSYAIEVDCANCANKMEFAVSKLPGIRSVNINFFAQKITLELESGSLPEDLMPQVLKACKKVERGCTIDF